MDVLSPEEKMLLDSVALANLREHLSVVGSYETEDDEDGEEAAEIAESCYNLARAFVRARRDALEDE